jgi:hypothetical protein
MKANKSNTLRLYFIRHGETEWSLSGRHTGRMDIPLTPNGGDEAREPGKHLLNIPFAHVLTSPLKRALHTCGLAGLDNTPEIEPYLAEWDFAHRSKPMNRQFAYASRHLLWACIPFLVLSFSSPAAAVTNTGTSPEPGSYCPNTDVLLVVAEELSASLDLTMHSRAAWKDKEPEAAIAELSSASTTIHLAASRGAAARTILVIDAIIQARTGDNYSQMLAWFPLLHASLLTLPDDATESAAEDFIAGAEEIMQGDKTGDPVVFLNQARHMLACDGLDIPIHEAIHAMDTLLTQLGQGKQVNDNAYDVLLDSLRSALLYALGE